MKKYRAIAGKTAVFCAITILAILIIGCSTSRVDEKFEAELSSRSEELKVGMDREQVEKIMKIPPCKFFFDEQEKRVVWFWSGQCNTPNPVKGHFDVSVFFNHEGTVSKIYSGVN